MNPDEYAKGSMEPWKYDTARNPNAVSRLAAEEAELQARNAGSAPAANSALGGLGLLLLAIAGGMVGIAWLSGILKGAAAVPDLRKLGVAAGCFLAVAVVLVLRGMRRRRPGSNRFAEFLRVLAGMYVIAFALVFLGVTLSTIHQHLTKQALFTFSLGRLGEAMWASAQLAVCPWIFLGLVGVVASARVAMSRR